MRKFLKIGGFISFALLLISVFINYGIYLDFGTGPWAVQYFLSNALSILIALALAIALFIENKTMAWLLFMIGTGYSLIGGIYALYGLSQVAVTLNLSAWMREIFSILLLIATMVGWILIHDKRGQVTVIITRLIGSSFSILYLLSITVVTSFINRSVWSSFLISTIGSIFSSVLVIVFVLFYYYKPKQPVMTTSQNDISFE